MLHVPPRIGIAGPSPWFGAIAGQVRAGGFEPVAFPSLAALSADLLDRYPALMVLDGDAPDWRQWIAACKVDQATRRLPLIVISHDPARVAAARTAGATDSLLAADLPGELIARIRQHARLLTPAELALLECQCQDELPPLARDGIAKFNRGAFYAQHDAFEAQWMAEPGPVRNLYRVILQVGVAYHHITQGNHAGGVKMLRRAEQWFALLPETCQGVDLRQFREDARRVRDALTALPPEAMRAFDCSLFRPVPLIAPPPSPDLHRQGP